jgi:hypothetical protein
MGWRRMHRNVFTAMSELETDFHSIERQIQVARLKLGSVLDYLEARTLEQPVIDRIQDYVSDVTSEVDRLLDALPQL